MNSIESLLKPASIRKGVERVEYSIDEALAVARQPSIHTMPGQRSTGGGQSEAGDGGEWAGTRTFAEADRLAIEGWAAGLEKADAMRAQLCGVLGSRTMRPKLTSAIAGFAPCVPLALAGDPESMYDIRRIESSGAGKVVHIVYNTCVSAGIDPDVIMLRGAVCMALVDALESANFRCQISLGIGCRQNGPNPQHEVVVNLKSAEESMSQDTLAFWLIHPAAFRRMTFAIWENVWPKDCAYPGLGMPTPVAEEMQGDIYLSEANLRNVNDETAIPFLKEQLKAYGIEFEN
jgi:hypothetical protein